MTEQFVKDLEHLINKHSIDALTETPDFILASMVGKFIESYAVTVHRNVQWHGWKPLSPVGEVSDGPSQS